MPILKKLRRNKLVLVLDRQNQVQAVDESVFDELVRAGARANERVTAGLTGFRDVRPMEDVPLSDLTGQRHIAAKDALISWMMKNSSNLVSETEEEE